MNASFVFNPPPASEYTEEPDAYSLKRECKRPPIRHTRRSSSGIEYIFVLDCARVRCAQSINLKRVTTGALSGCATYVYYYPDATPIVETIGIYKHRVHQLPFCSYRCLSLWAKHLAKGE